MNNNSYIYLKQELSECKITDSKIVNNTNGEGDCSNWIAKIQPFIKQFCQDGDIILDPFAQQGTTLIAASILGFKSIGVESNLDNLDIIKARIKVYDELLRYIPEIINGDILSTPLPEKANVVITTAPSFYSSKINEEVNVSGLSEYTIYLNQIEQVIRRCEKILSHQGYFILFAKNQIQANGNMIPQAFDIVKLIQKYFNLKEERIILFPTELDEALDPSATNRAHTYAFIGAKREKKVLLQPFYDFINQIKSIEYALIGPFALSLIPEKIVLDNPPTSLDIIISNQEESVKEVIKILTKLGFDISTRDGKLFIPSYLENFKEDFLCATKRVNSTEYRIKIIFHSKDYNLASLLANRLEVRSCYIAKLDDIKEMLIYENSKFSRALYHRLKQL